MSGGPMTDDFFFSVPALALAALMLETPEKTVAALKALDDLLRAEEESDLLETISQQRHDGG
jgi:hypothetical protein